MCLMYSTYSFIISLISFGDSGIAANIDQDVFSEMRSYSSVFIPHLVGILHHWSESDDHPSEISTVFLEFTECDVFFQKDLKQAFAHKILSAYSREEQENIEIVPRRIFSYESFLLE